MSKRNLEKEKSSGSSKRKSAALAHILSSSKRSLSTMRGDLVKFIESFDKSDPDGSFNELQKFVDKTDFAPKHAWFVFLAICEALRELGTRRNEAKRKAAGKAKEKEKKEGKGSAGSSSESAALLATTSTEGEEEQQEEGEKESSTVPTTISIEVKSEVTERSKSPSASKSPSEKVMATASSLFIKTSPSNESKPQKEEETSLKGDKEESNDDSSNDLSKWLIPMKTAFDAIGIESIDLHDPVITGMYSVLFLFYYSITIAITMIINLTQHSLLSFSNHILIFPHLSLLPSLCHHNYLIIIILS